MSTLREQAESLHGQVESHLPEDSKEEYGVDELEAMLDEYVNEYLVPPEAAFESVRGNVLKEAGVDMSTFYATQNAGDSGSVDEPLSVADCDRDGAWVTVRARVVELWEPRNESIQQVGLLGDESGTIKFVAWKKSNPRHLSEGTTYTFENVAVEEYQGRFSVKINSRTEISEHTTDSDEAVSGVGPNSTSYQGVLVAIQNQSGLIRRCPASECTRVLTNGRCEEHGEVEGEYDLRIKAVLDDGRTVQHAVFDPGMTEAVSGINLQTAKETAAEELDIGIVEEQLKDLLIGRAFHVEGPVLGQNLVVNEVSETTKKAFPGGREKAIMQILTQFDYDGPGLEAASAEDLLHGYGSMNGGAVTGGN